MFFFKKINKWDGMSISNISSITQVQFQSGHGSHTPSVCLSQEQQAECVTSGVALFVLPPMAAPRAPPSLAHPSYSKCLKTATSLLSLLSKPSGWGTKFQAAELEAFGFCCFCQSEGGPFTLQGVLVPRT